MGSFEWVKSRLNPLIYTLEVLLEEMPNPPKNELEKAKNIIKVSLNDPRVHQSLGERQYRKIVNYMKALPDRVNKRDIP